MKFVFYLISEWPSTTTPKCKNSSDDIFNIDAEEEMTERLFDERSEEDLLKLIDENSICESSSLLSSNSLSVISSSASILKMSSLEFLHFGVVVDGHSEIK
ncbi:12273_t:CDS:2 [Entrophospora sp. SA101]|nr:12273_t:CDS:2 [Entrophospora sp. SA101]